MLYLHLHTVLSLKLLNDLVLVTMPFFSFLFFLHGEVNYLKLSFPFVAAAVIVGIQNYLFMLFPFNARFWSYDS